jgi:hypothetical protein
VNPQITSVRSGMHSREGRVGGKCLEAAGNEGTSADERFLLVHGQSGSASTFVSYDAAFNSMNPSGRRRSRFKPLITVGFLARRAPGIHEGGLHPAETCFRTEYRFQTEDGA